MWKGRLWQRTTSVQFKELLRKLRNEAGLTQLALAKKSGVPISNLRGYEQGHRLPSWPAVVRLSRGLDVSCEAFEGCEEVATKAPRKRPKKGK
jgi:transcriptional regulator with XRE-family HTH domain